MFMLVFVFVVAVVLILVRYRYNILRRNFVTVRRKSWAGRNPWPLANASFGVDIYKTALRVVDSVIFAIIGIRDTISPFVISLGEVNILPGAEIKYRAELLVPVLSHLEVRIPVRFRARRGAISRVTTDQSDFLASLRGRRGAVVKSWTSTPLIRCWLGWHLDLK